MNKLRRIYLAVWFAKMMAKEKIPATTVTGQCRKLFKRGFVFHQVLSFYQRPLIFIPGHRQYF